MGNKENQDTIAKRLQEVIDIKKAIKDALIECGLTPNNDFTTYASEILKLKQ